MSESRFRKYDHVERIDHPDVEHIDVGVVHVFPKLDGTNSSVWLQYHDMPEGHDIRVHAGNRNRHLTAEGAADNADFAAWVRENEVKWLDLLMRQEPEVGAHLWRVYGEWLVPHTINGYREDSWRRFWVFDVHDPERGYLPYACWAPLFVDAGFDVVEPLCTIENPTREQLLHQVELNTYLMADGAGPGEGIVLKNYSWRNGYGRQPWAKIVRTEFKEQSQRAFGVPHKHGAFQIEAAIAEEYVTPTLVAKCRAKILLDLANDDDSEGGTATALVSRAFEEKHRRVLIPRLLQTVYTDVVREELYPVIKKYKDPTIDFKKLRAQCIRFTKQWATDLF